MISLSYSKLGKGDHEITVEVSDGTGHSEMSFTLNVKEEGSSPMGGEVPAVVLLTALGVILGSRRRKEPPS